MKKDKSFQAITNLSVQYEGSTQKTAQLLIGTLYPDSAHRQVPLWFLPFDLAHDLRQMMAGGSGFIVNWSVQDVVSEFQEGFRISMRHLAPHTYYPPTDNVLRRRPFRLDPPDVK